MYGPEDLAFLRMAVKNGGVPCPRCGFDLSSDGFALMIYRGTGKCMVCNEPIPLEIPAEFWRGGEDGPPPNP